MPQGLDVAYRIGLNKGQLKTAAQLYDEAFGKKFAVAIKSRQDRLKLYESAFVGRFAIVRSGGISEPVGSQFDGFLRWN